MNVSLLEYPTDEDWIECKRRALITIGKKPINYPDMEWRRKMLEARHSPIRRLRFSFLLKNIPSFVSVHLCRHIHAQPYVKSQRNDRQSDYDRNKAPQDSPVDMIWDLNADEWMTVASKRLCSMADETTREIIKECVKLTIEKCPEFEGMLKPPCEWQNGKCYEFNGGCGRRNEENS